MIALETVTANLWRHWQAEFPADIPTVYPGQRVNTSDWTRWVELWVGGWERGASRDGTTLAQVQLTLHVYSREREKPLSATQVVDEVRTVIERRLIAIPYGSDSPTAWLRIRELETEDLSRKDAEAFGRGFRHLVARCVGEVTACAAA